MSSKSNDQGRAYEYACLHTLEEEVGKVRPVKVEHNSSYEAAEHSWNTLSAADKIIYKTSAKAAVIQIFGMEPRILEDGGDVLEILIQQDRHGEDGDVRDILIVRRNITWEIGLSLKHNHFAVKHSRLSRTLDFGKSWYEIPCSEAYWKSVNPVFEYLLRENGNGTMFRDFPDKDGDVYIPILNAFIDEVTRQNAKNPGLPRKMVEYLLGKFDFYKVISMDGQRTTKVQGFNLHGMLNQDGEKKKASVEVPVVALPSRIVKMEMAPGSSTTAELYLDGGWQFSFRIHNAEKIAVPSLKFDIQIVGMPTAIITIDCIWN